MSIIINIMSTMFFKLLTEKFISKVLVDALGALSKKTTNKLDNKIIDNVAEALDVRNKNVD